VKVNMTSSISDDGLPAFTKTQNSHDNGTEEDSHPDTDSNPGFDSAFDSDSKSSSKSHDDLHALLDNEPEIFPDTVSFGNESPASPDMKSDLGRDPDSLNALDASSIPKAKTTALPDDVPESIVSNSPSTDSTGDSITALLDGTFTAPDDNPTVTHFASVSDDPMTRSVSAATMMALPKPRPPPSPPATLMPLTSTVPHPSVMPSLSSSISSGAFRIKVISREGAIIALFVAAIAAFL